MNKSETITSLPAGKLPLLVKIGYSIGNVAKALLAVSTGAFLLYFYVNVCGIDSKVASTIILAAKIWDIINDPMMGAVVDRTKSKEGKCRFYLKWFSVPAGIIFALSFFMPDFAAPGKVVWAAVTYVLQGMMSTILLIPMNTLMGRITVDQQQRVQLNQFCTLFSLAGSMLVQAFTMRLVMSAGGEDMVKGFAVVGILYGIIYAICHLIVFFSTKGYEPLEHLQESEDESPDTSETLNEISLKERLGALLKNGMWLAIIGMFLLQNLSMALENSTMAFYFQYNHNNDMSLYSIFSTVGTVAALIDIAILNIITKKIGLARTAGFGACLACFGYLLRYFLHDASHMVMTVGWFSAQIGGSLISCTVLLLIFQSREYGMRKTGIDNDAILMSGFSVSYKTGMAIGGAILGYVMPAAFVNGAATQTAEVQAFFLKCSTFLPGICYAIVIVLCILIRRYEKTLKAEAK